MTARLPFAFLAALALLAACGAVPNVRVELLPGRGGTGQAAPAAPADGARLRASLYGRDITADLVKTDQRGAVADWAGPDGAGVREKTGVLIGTRGLGHDLYSADADPILAAMAGGPEQYTRSFRHMDGLGRITETVADCRLSAPDEMGVRAELCRAPGFTFTNRFKLAPAGGVVASRQWISREGGYIGLSPIAPR